MFEIVDPPSLSPGFGIETGEADVVGGCPRCPPCCGATGRTLCGERPKNWAPSSTSSKVREAVFVQLKE